MLRLPPPTCYRQKVYAHKRLTKDQLASENPLQLVPRFFDFYHPTTMWLINVIRNENERELSRVLMDKQAKSLLKFQPDPRAIQDKQTVLTAKFKDFIITKGKYFQIIDRPDYFQKDDSRAPLFNRHAVMYLTPLGLAIYLRKPKAARILVEAIDRDTNAKHILARQPQFISYMNDRFGDLMCMYDHTLAMLNEEFHVLMLMLQNGNWFPMEPFMMLYRKRFVETKLFFDDFMDYSFYIMFTKRSSFNLPGLCSALLKGATEHFRPTFLARPSRANEKTLVRCINRVINNCKSYARRLLRCAYYADKKMKSSLNLVVAAELFVRTGMFKLVGEPALPFCQFESEDHRLDHLERYKQFPVLMQVDWPRCYYEFDADCCIALLLGMIAKSHRLNKMPTFRASLRLATTLLADCGWLNHFDEVCDMEFKDYFIGMDDAEKVSFETQTFGFLRESCRVTVIDQCYDLSRFFSQDKIEELRTTQDLTDPAVLTKVIMCNDERITKYVALENNEPLASVGSIISGERTRKDEEKRAQAGKNSYPRMSVQTMMINAANVQESEDSSEASNLNAVDSVISSDSRRQEFDIFKPELVKSAQKSKMKPLNMTEMQHWATKRPKSGRRRAW